MATLKLRIDRSVCPGRMERPMSSIKFRQVIAGLAALVVVAASLGAIAGQIDKLLLHQSTSSGDIETVR